jgi:hypothetical protein
MIRLAAVIVTPLLCRGKGAMPPKPLPLLLPHLKPDELEDRDHEELVLSRKLTSCWSGGDDFDVERAYQIMRGAAELIFDVTYKAYYRKVSYKAEWLPEIVNEAVFRTLKTSLPCVRDGIPDTRFSDLADTLEATVLDHIEELATLKKHASLLNDRQVAEYAKAGVDLTSGSPLLIMAATQTNTIPVQVPLAPSVAVELRRLLEEARIKPEDIAEAIGIQPRNVYRHLSGQTRPSITNIGKYEQAISKRLGRKVLLPHVSKTSKRQ